MTKVSFNEANAKTATNLRNYCAELGISTEGQNIGAMKQALKEKGVDSTTVNHIAKGNALTTAENEELQRLISGSGNQPVSATVPETNITNAAQSAADANEQNTKAANENYKQAKANAAEKKRLEREAKEKYDDQLKKCKQAESELTKLRNTSTIKMNPSQYKKYKEDLRTARNTLQNESNALKPLAHEYREANRDLIKSLKQVRITAKNIIKVNAKGSESANTAKSVRGIAKQQIKTQRIKTFKTRINPVRNFMMAKGGMFAIGLVCTVAAACLVKCAIDAIVGDEQTKVETNEETPVVEEQTAQNNSSEVVTDGEQASTVQPATEDSAVATTEETATTSESDDVNAEIAEAEEVAAQVEEQVKKYSYNPGNPYKVEKGDCLWNIVKGLLEDKLHRAPTDAEILQGVRKWVEEDDSLAYTDDTHQKVLILPGQEITQIAFDAVA